MTEVITWIDKDGMRRSSNTERTDRPRAATIITIHGLMALLAGKNVIIADFYQSCTLIPVCDVRFL
jgi:hypothetical protein